MMVLYYSHPACSMASHIALEESGLPYEPIAVNLADAAQRDELLKLNPKGKIPTMTVNGQVITENIAILFYVAQMAPRAALLPGNDFDRAQCLSMLSWYASTVHIAFRQGWRPEKFADDQRAQRSVRKMGRKNYWEAMQTIDQRLNGNQFVMGGQFSLADTYPMVFYNWGVLAEFPMMELRHYTAFKDRMISRSAVRTVLEREGSRLLTA